MNPEGVEKAIDGHTQGRYPDLQSENSTRPEPHW